MSIIGPKWALRCPNTSPLDSQIIPGSFPEALITTAIWDSHITRRATEQQAVVLFVDNIDGISDESPAIPFPLLGKKQKKVVLALKNISYFVFCNSE